MLRKLALAAAALVVTGSAAMAADLYVPETAAPIVEATGTSFEGFYAGAQLGGYFEDGDSQGVIGGVIGYNFAADPLLLGVELQGNYYLESDSIDAAGELLALGKIGFVAADNFAVYATGGVGYVWTDTDDYGEYALGLGAEYKVTEDVSLRATVLGFGFDDGGDFFDGASATAGVLFHF